MAMIYYFIVNQSGGSGNARRTWQCIHRLLKEQGIAYKAYPTRYEKHATLLAKKISLLPQKEIRLIVVGGDGTINEVLNGIHDFKKIRLGIIPTGSGNDFARGLKLPKQPAAALKKILASDGKACIDLGQVTFHHGQKHLFGISSGVGLDAIVCRKVENSHLKKLLNRFRLGNLAYVLMTVQTLFSMKKHHVTVHINNDAKKPSQAGTLSDEQHSLQTRSFNKLIFLAGMNLPAEGGGVPMAPHASAHDGMLSVCAANDVPKWRAFILLLYLTCGKHQGKKGVHLFHTTTLTLTSKTPMILHSDGEYLGEVTEVTMEILPSKLHVLL